MSTQLCLEIKRKLITHGTDGLFMVPHLMRVRDRGRLKCLYLKKEEEKKEEEVRKSNSSL